MIISNIIRDFSGDLQSFKFSTNVVGDRAIVPFIFYFAVLLDFKFLLGYKLCKKQAIEKLMRIIVFGEKRP